MQIEYHSLSIFFLLLSRIVIVASLAHTFARNGISFDDINYEKNFNSREAYGQSKLANVLHCRELAKKLENTGISVYSLHPGK